MASIAAVEVAKEVISEVRKGKIPNRYRISVKHGYSPQSAKASKAVRTKAYQSVITPLVERLEEERNAVVEALKTTRSKAKYRDLIDGLDKITKNIQLLTGGATSNIAMGVRRLKDDELISIAEGSKD